MANSFNPFGVFRKYQKTALAAITLLSMFAFVCVGPAMMGRGSGGGSNQIPAVAKWNYGEILRTEVENKLTWRIRINRFFAKVYERAKELKKVEADSQLRGRFLPETQDGILQAIVLAKKAELMGMSVSDTSVNEYIDAVTNGPLSQEDKDKALVEAIGESRGSAAQVSNQFFDALRFELLSRNFAILLMHDSVDYDTPEERWDYYSRLYRTATVQVLPVAVKDFVGQIHDPSNDELEALFDKYKDQQSRADLPEPGFKVPPRGKFGYFKAVRATLVKADEPKITDAEINDYYASHKESFRKSTFDDSALPTTGDKPKTEDKPKPDTKPATGKPATDDKSKVDDKAKTDDKSKTDDKPKSEAKPVTDKPTTDDKSKADDKAKPDDKAKSEDKPKTDAKSTDDKSSNARPVIHHLADDELLALADPIAPPDTKSPDTKPAGSGSTAKDKGSTAKPDADKTPPAKAEPPKTEPAKTEPAKTEPSKTPPAKTEPAKTKTETPIVEFDPVTDPKVRSQIRTTLATQKAQNEINDSFTKLRAEIQKYRDALSQWRAYGSHPADEPEAPDFKDLAKGFSVTFEQTDMVSAEEARDKTELGKSTKVDEIHFRLIPFSQMAFDVNLPNYLPAESDSADGEISYLWWRSDFAPTYVPAFADAKPEVMRAWKMIEARKLALDEAKKDAAEANKRLSTLKDIFQNRANMTVSTIGPFHWLSVANVPMGTSMQQIPQITQLSGLDLAEVEFMRTVFTTEVGSTGVAFNQPQTIAYVVQVQKVEPPEDIFRQQFQTYQSEHAQNWGIAGLAAEINAEQVVKPAKLRAVEEALGFQRLVPQAATGQGSSSAPAPSEEDSD